MDDRDPPPATLSTSIGEHCCHPVEEDGGDTVACNGKSCRSCTAGVIADCVAVCCCPCGVVNILTLAFLKLPLAVARRSIGGWRKKSKQDKVEEKSGGDGSLGEGRAEDGTSEIVSAAEAGDGVCGPAATGGGGLGNDDFGAEDVWLELHEVEQMGFGRVSFSGVDFHEGAIK
ncbi:hypothetical protein CASFOL_026429 [Castilleja foliolosa]|uniref:Uncharacterized protein n=1 Tax=Castilleja foliolosa TaxID=1961234 RepID=A0ABD3CKQ9_9LAMI